MRSPPESRTLVPRTLQARLKEPYVSSDPPELLGRADKPQDGCALGGVGVGGGASTSMAKGETSTGKGFIFGVFSSNNKAVNRPAQSARTYFLLNNKAVKRTYFLLNNKVCDLCVLGPGLCFCVNQTLSSGSSVERDRELGQGWEIKRCRTFLRSPPLTPSQLTVCDEGVRGGPICESGSVSFTFVVARDSCVSCHTLYSVNVCEVSCFLSPISNL